MAHVRQVLAPAPRSGDVVVLDKLASHERAAGRAIQAAGAAAYLTAYSPDLNPIELAFAKSKARLRAAALRTSDEVEDFFGTVHDDFTDDECRRYTRHAGYTAAAD